jgi:hypothetical protein
VVKFDGGTVLFCRKVSIYLCDFQWLSQNADVFIEVHLLPSSYQEVNKQRALRSGLNDIAAAIETILSLLSSTCIAI